MNILNKKFGFVSKEQLLGNECTTKCNCILQLCNLARIAILPFRLNRLKDNLHQYYFCYFSLPHSLSCFFFACKTIHPLWRFFFFCNCGRRLGIEWNDNKNVLLNDSQTKNKEKFSKLNVLRSFLFFNKMQH
jgi:hypothetical protein